MHQMYNPLFSSHSPNLRTNATSAATRAAITVRVMLVGRKAVPDSADDISDAATVSCVHIAAFGAAPR